MPALPKLYPDIVLTRLPPGTLERIRARLPPGGTISGFIRDAVSEKIVEELSDAGTSNRKSSC
jgi:hypothetical protein